MIDLKLASLEDIIGELKRREICFAFGIESEGRFDVRASAPPQAKEIFSERLARLVQPKQNIPSELGEWFSLEKQRDKILSATRSRTLTSGEQAELDRLHLELDKLSARKWGK